MGCPSAGTAEYVVVDATEFESLACTETTGRVGTKGTLGGAVTVVIHDRIDHAECAKSGRFLWERKRTSGRQTIMNRANIAAVLGVAMLSAAGCGSASDVATGGSEPTNSISSRPDAARGSACLSTPTTGDSIVMVDWVDFVQLDRTQYVAGVDGKVPAIASNQLGSVVGRVECELSVLKFHAEPGTAVDGDAAFLKVGTEVHAVRGYATSCRVAAQIAGVNRVYLAHADLAGVSRAVPCAKAP